MALTTEDLNQISTIVTNVVDKVVSGLATKSELSDLAVKIEEDMDRMEGGLTTAMGLLQRNTFSRLDEHETRIANLERATSH